MTGINLIYGLIHPVTGELRYIGQTTNGKSYCNKYYRTSFAKQNRPVSCWIRKLQSSGLNPEIYFFEENVETKNRLNELEIFYISYFKSLGSNLLNLSSGGNSNHGFTHSNEYKKKLSLMCSKNNKLQNARSEYFKNNSHPKWYNNVNSDKYKILLKNQSSDANKLSVIKCSKKIQDNNGVIYSSQAQAARELNVSPSAITNYLKGKGKSVKGFTFKRIT